MKKGEFTKNVEKLVDPITVGPLHFIEQFNRLLPKFIQSAIIKSSSASTPFMGFVVEPYAFFLCYEISDVDKASKLLPDNFKLVKTKVFADDEPQYYGIVGCFRSHTSAFWGIRAEYYLIAEDKNTGLLTWVIMDYDSDTISYDSRNGLQGANSHQSVHTTDYNGMLYVDIERNDKSRHIAFSAKINDCHMEKLDQRLWLEGNLSVGYGKSMSKNPKETFSLKFEPDEVAQALNIPLSDVTIENNSWQRDIFKENPSQLACFPYAQHFVSDSPGFSSQLKNRDELSQAIKEIDFKNAKMMSAKSFKYMLGVNLLLSIAITLTLNLLLIYK
jgi:hypothetical protein